MNVCCLHPKMGNMQTFKDGTKENMPLLPLFVYLGSRLYSVFNVLPTLFGQWKLVYLQRAGSQPQNGTRNTICQAC
jgi:hypothetical protein